MRPYDLSQQARLEALPLLGHIAADGQTFAKKDALRRIDLIPVAPGSAFR